MIILKPISRTMWPFGRGRLAKQPHRDVTMHAAIFGGQKDTASLSALDQ